MVPCRLAAFFGLSFLSGLFELGVVFRGLNQGQTLVLAFGLALAYQLGTLVPYPLGIRRWPSLAIGLGALILLAKLTASTALTTFWLLPLVTMTSAAINVGRITLGKAEISTTLKRCTRVAGFMCSPLLMLDPVLCISIVSAVTIMSVAVALHHRATGRPSFRIAGGRHKYMTSSLFFHQVHYFSYCTVILVMLSTQHNPWLAAAVFVGGWATYIAAPHLIWKTTDPEYVALLGHIVLPFVLCGLALVEPNSPLWYTLWLLTGPFGGTIVFLTRYAKGSHDYDETALMSVENTGHCVGSAIAVAWIATALPLPGLLFIAAAFAALTAFTLVLSLPTQRIAIWRSGQ